MGEPGLTIFRWFGIVVATVLVVPVVNWASRALWGFFSVESPWKTVKKRARERVLRSDEEVKRQRALENAIISNQTGIPLDRVDIIRRR